MNALDQLKKHTVVVADTGDIEAIGRHQPQDATTNPSLLYKAAQMPQYADLVEAAIVGGRASGRAGDALIDLVMDKLSVAFGTRILQIIPGRVSTEVDARLSFDEHGTVEKARQLIGLYQASGIATQRILIKIASTWEGIRAAERLEREGIHCNLTLLFGFGQAVACADAGVTLISPFVGRIYDWYRNAKRVDQIPIQEDPGVESVTRIYHYYKKHGYRTEVMGASFRTAAQVTALCGCDLLTIAPALLSELAESQAEVPQRLNVDTARSLEMPRISLNESAFRWTLNEDAMATEKLAEGIRGFSADLDRLRAWLLPQCTTT